MKALRFRQLLHGMGVPSILNAITKTSLAVGMALTLLGGAAASADSLTVQQRAQAEMNKGKDYTAAWQAAMRTDVPSYAPELIAKAKKAADQMNQGKDYVAARSRREATDSIHSQEQIARAKRAQEAMNEGKDYVAAREAADKVQPTNARALGSAGTVSTIK